MVSGGVDVVVGDEEIDVVVLDAARYRKVPIVSAEWLVQCLITGKLRQYDAHPKYKHDFHS